MQYIQGILNLLPYDVRFQSLSAHVFSQYYNMAFTHCLTYFGKFAPCSGLFAMNMLSFPELCTV